MWRALFCAVGIVLVIMGLECLAIDSAVFVAGVVDEPATVQQAGGLFAPPPAPTTERIFRPSEALPWSLLAIGSIVMLYSISLRKTGA